MMLEVLPEHHGLPQLDQISLGGYGLHSAKFPVLLFSYGTKTVVLANCAVRQKIKLKLCITKVIKLEVPEIINFITVNPYEEIMFIVGSQGGAYESAYGSESVESSYPCLSYSNCESEDV